MPRSNNASAPGSRVRILPLLVDGQSPFRGHDDEWTPPCSEQDSRLWTNPRDRAEVRQAASVCHEKCDRRVDCFAAARSRSEWGVWGGTLMVGGHAAKQFQNALWLDDRHLTAEERDEIAVEEKRASLRSADAQAALDQAAEVSAQQHQLRDMLAPYLDAQRDAGIGTWLDTAIRA